MSIKDLPIRAYKIGKTRGRPSKEEMNTSMVLSWYLLSGKMNLDNRDRKCYKVVCEDDDQQ